MAEHGRAMMTALHVSSQQSRAPKVLKRTNDRIILHFDYDCFYASVFENENPALKALPLGIKQKSILATCNYVARVSISLGHHVNRSPRHEIYVCRPNAEYPIAYS